MGGIEKFRINDCRYPFGILLGKPCNHCGKCMVDEMMEKRYVWKKISNGRTKYYCDNCKHELFEGVKRWEK